MLSRMYPFRNIQTVPRFFNIQTCNYEFQRNQFNMQSYSHISRRCYRLENCFPCAPVPPPPTMSPDPAVAAPAAQVPLRHAREVYRCTLFGTSQAWDIPDALRGLRRSSGAFRAWYMVQFRLTRKSLAARGNMQACKSIKAQNDRHIWYMKRRRAHQRAVAQQIALWGNAGPCGELVASLDHGENVD